MAIPDPVKTNVDTRLRAAAAGDRALVQGTDARTGAARFILCAVVRDGGPVVLTPFGHLADGNPDERYDPPFDPGGERARAAGAG